MTQYGEFWHENDEESYLNFISPFLVPVDVTIQNHRILLYTQSSGYFLADARIGNALKHCT